MRFHTYFRSNTSHRVRIVLNLKGLRPEQVFVNLRENAHRTDAYRALNPQGLVPILEDGEGVFSQSLAIMEYLDETRSKPPLMPKDPAGRARVRSLMQVCACDMHPLNNLRVLRYLAHDLKLDEAMRNAWCRRWMVDGLDALEARLAHGPETGRYCHGDSVTLADACLVPQTVSALRWLPDLKPWPTVRRLHETCLDLEAFAAAMPAKQPDATA